jgi:hypothetical protein
MQRHGPQGMHMQTDLMVHATPVSQMSIAYIVHSHMGTIGLLSHRIRISTNAAVSKDGERPQRIFIQTE